MLVCGGEHGDKATWMPQYIAVGNCTCVTNLQRATNMPLIFVHACTHTYTALYNKLLRKKERSQINVKYREWKIGLTK